MAQVDALREDAGLVEVYTHEQAGKRTGSRRRRATGGNPRQWEQCRQPVRYPPALDTRHRRAGTLRTSDSLAGELSRVGDEPGHAGIGKNSARQYQALPSPPSWKLRFEAFSLLRYTSMLPETCPMTLLELPLA
jgi:hypothetical protein